MSDPSPHIGTLREKPLHAALKEWCRVEDDSVEVPVDGFVIDLVRGELLIEVQTSGFASMKKKVNDLLAAGHSMRIVYPIAVDTTIIKIDGDGTVLDQRLSPKHGQPAELFAKLVSFPEMLAKPGFEIEVVSIIEEQVRHHVPDKSWRRKGWTILERRLVDVVESRLIDGADRLVELLPEDLPDPFTTADLASCMGSTRRLAQQAAYCLRRSGVADEVGRRGRAIEYRLRR